MRSARRIRRTPENVHERARARAPAPTTHRLSQRTVNNAAISTDRMVNFNV